MNFLVRALVFAVFLAVAPVAIAQNDERQFYTEWRPQNEAQTQWICKYYFKSDPTADKYKFQWVVWNRKWPDKVFYMNSKQQYWCAAPIGHTEEAWFVFAEKSATLNEAVLPEESVHPAIPGSDRFDQAEMAFPTFDGLPVASN